ncbi:Bro-N domain-containing protein [Patescibacteria group bacterium]|nr:Bro-N domain-containing protein [Patescibacteria group bacterium]MBU4056889.1 Bro-N domain-containing protein [Patescibacteria group bacterium]MBU4142276.1 Bro-N domain-containing protein [Patescibacteria group bacterium]
MTTKIAIFKGKKARKTIHKNEWWFSIIDIIEALTDTERPRKYWNDLKKKITDEGYFEVSEKIGQLKLLANDGKKYLTDCANTETMFRIIQSIPSPKAEPFKRWLAKVGYERIKEIEDPELATKRTHAIYKAKGYSESWIAKRMRGIEVRETLTDEWKKRGAKEDTEYSILTAEISKAAFGMTPSQYKKFKGLKRENLRDHMDDLELILTMLGEATTTKITRDKNSKGFIPLKQDAKEGGEVAGSARKDIERRTSKPVSTRTNFLKYPQNKKLLKDK